MKKQLIWKAMAFCLFTMFSACDSPSTTTEANLPAVETQTMGMATDSTAAPVQQLAYRCPMECEGSASMEPGKCPVCGMDLEKNPNYTASAESTGQE